MNSIHNSWLHSALCRRNKSNVPEG